jgi:hypothetical protein
VRYIGSPLPFLLLPPSLFGFLIISFCLSFLAKEPHDCPTSARHTKKPPSISKMVGSVRGNNVCAQINAQTARHTGDRILVMKYINIALLRLWNENLFAPPLLSSLLSP